MIDSILRAGLAGMQRSLASANKHADIIASPNSSLPEGDKIGAMIGLMQDKASFKASAAVIRVAQEVQDELDRTFEIIA